MGKLKREFKNPVNDTFDWSLYENGYNGKNLIPNPKVKISSLDKVIVYSHEHYAQDLLNKYFVSNAPITPKDAVEGAMMRVTSIRPSDKSSIIVDTDGGGSFKIDLNKERDLVKFYGMDKVEDFANVVASSKENADALMENIPFIKVLSKDRVSLWASHIQSIADQLDTELKNKKSTTYFNGKIIGSNNGGYIVDIGGLHCFMPGSMAAAGVITDFDSLIGKDVQVMVINYVNGMGYVVSYKKYLSMVMPKMVADELSIDMKVNTKVTGLSKNGVFVSFNNKNDEPVFSGLIHRDNMSPHMEDLFDEGNFMVGDMLYAYIHNIVMDGDKIRIILGDTSLEDPCFADKRAKLVKNPFKERKEKENA